MTKVTLNNVGSLIDATTAASTINSNNTKIQTAFDNTLSRDGTAPNKMAASIDMDSNRILNLPVPTTSSEPVRLIEFEEAVIGQGLDVPFHVTNTTQSTSTSSGSFITDGGMAVAKDLFVGGNLHIGSFTASPTELDFVGSTSGTTILKSSAVASGTLTLPAATDTLVGKATTDTLTNKTLTSPVINTPTGIVKGDVGLGNVDNTSDATKNTAVATLTNKTLVAPALGTPASGVATNLTGTAAGLTAGSVTTNANLTGPITSAGNATSIASQTGTGTKFVVDTSPTLVTPNLGTPSAATLTNATGLPVSTGISGLAAGVASFLATPSSANLKTAVTDETGSGALTFATSPTLVTPVLGAATATTINGNTLTTGTYTVTGGTGKTLTFNNSIGLSGTDGTTFTFPTFTDTVATLGNTQTFSGLKIFSPNLFGLVGSTSGQMLLNAAAVTGSAVVTLPGSTDTLVGKATTDTLTNKTFDTAGTGNSFSINGVAATANTGTGSVVRATSPTLVTPVLGTPSSGTLTSCTGLPISTGVSGLGTNVATFLATPSSSNLASAMTDETGSGALVFATSPTLVTPALGVATATTVNGVTIDNNAWTSYSPTITSGSGTFTGATITSTARYKQLGKTVFVQADVTLTALGSGSPASTLKVTLPFTAAAFEFLGASQELQVTGKSGTARIPASSTTMNALDSTAATYIAAGNRVAFTAIYEVP